MPSPTSIPAIPNAPVRGPLGQSEEVFWVSAQPVNLGQVGGTNLALGQTNMLGSVPVTLAVDQTLTVWDSILLELARIRAGIGELCNRDLANEITIDDIG